MNEQVNVRDYYKLNSFLEKIDELQALLQGKQKILILTHINPDGDAVGSALAVKYALKSLDLSSEVVLTNKPTGELATICNPDDYKIYDSSFVSSSKKYDLIFVVDCGNLSRVGETLHLVQDDTPIVNVDHHIEKNALGKITFSYPLAAATCEILAEIFLAMNISISLNCANALYLGLTTDTGRFAFGNVSSRTHEILAKLLSYGVNPTKIHNQLSNSYDENYITGISLTVEHTLYSQDRKIAVTYFTKKDMDMLKGLDANVFLPLLMSLKKTKIVAFIKETENLHYRVSTRTKADYDMSLFCQRYNGGGHKKAAAFTYDGLEIHDFQKQLLEELITFSN